MEPDQERLIEEKTELDEKIVKLDHFCITSDVFIGLPNDEKRRMQEQLKVMRRYSEILEERISDFP